MELCSLTADVAISPCTLNDYIHCKNVVSKTYVVPENRVQQAMEDFISAIADAKLDNSSLPFFIMETIENKWIRMKIYMSVVHNNPKLPTGLHFDSYFCVDNMVSLCVSREPERYLSDAYVKLFSYLQENSFRAITPVFQVLGGDKQDQYTFLKVGYTQI